MNDTIITQVPEYGNFIEALGEAVTESEVSTDHIEKGLDAVIEEKVVFQPGQYHAGNLPEFYTTDAKTGEIKAITRAEFKKWRHDNVTVRYQKVPMCGHKFIPQVEPRHKSCEACWFAFFNVHGELTQAVEEAYQKQGAALIVKLKGNRFKNMFLKFMGTVAALKAASDARAAQEKAIESTGSTEGSNSTTEPGEGIVGTLPESQGF